MELPYLTDGLPGVGGRLRAQPEHFEVVEIPLYEASGEGEHLYVNITKVGLTTRQVQCDLAQLFGLKQSGVGLAGLKDKRARTTQTFSIHLGIKDPEFARQSAERIEEALGVHVNWAKFHRNKLRTGHLLGNHFSIVVSDLECDVREAVERCSRISEALKRRGLPNFYGPQRFGTEGGNVEQGIGILQGSVTRRDRWLCRFLVSSVQSYLCNLYLAERLQRGMFDQLMMGDVAKKHDTGGIFEVESVEAEQPRYAAQEISFTAPIFGPKMRQAQHESGALEASVLRQTSVALEDFARSGAKGTRRMGRLLVDDLTCVTRADALVFHFSLPKGAYATTVLREFIKDDRELAADGDAEYGGDEG